MLKEVLSRIPDMEPETIERLLAHFDGVEDLLRSRDYEVAAASGLPLSKARELLDFLRENGPDRVVEGEVRRCERCGRLVLNATLCEGCQKGLCPRCGSYMDAMPECPICGWRPEVKGGSIATDFKMRWGAEDHELVELLEKYDALLRKYPEDPRLWEVRGEILERMGRDSEARNAFRKAYELYLKKEGRAPTSVVSRLGAADGLVDAFKKYSALAEQEGTNPKLWEAAADLAARLGDREYERYARDRARECGEAWMGSEVAGRGSRDGHRNGRRSRGFTNGRVNGRINGHVNGHVNGFVNGGGKVNGFVNGAINGLVNRIVQEGLINGNGLVNGNTIARRIKPPGRPRWQRLVAASAILLIILLSPLLLYTLFVPYTPIAVDGSFGEWRDIPPIWDRRGDVANPIADILEYRMIGMGDRTYLYIRLQDSIFNTSSGVYVFVDADNNETTGYPLGNMGADYMVEVYGWDDNITSRKLHVYNDTFAGSWNGFTYLGSLPVAVRGSEMEMMLPINATGGTIEVVATDYRGNVDYGDLAAAPSRSLLALRVRDMADVAPFGAWTPLISMDYVTWGGCEVRWINLSFEGTSLPQDVVFRLLHSGQNISMASPDVHGYVNFSFPARTLRGNGTFVVEVLPVGGTSLGRTVSLRPVNLGTDALLTVWDEREERAYVGAVPSEVFIDGSFQDWSGVMNDTIGDVLDAAGSSVPYSYTTIDLSGYAVRRTLRDTKFFISTYGRVMGGMDVPVVRDKTLVDSDRDTIPDYLDPHPHDFDNDGVDDAAEGGDVDGDGVLDYPAGEDLWLNTTIPDDPANYSDWAGRNVTVYIGPVKRVTRVYGNDTIAIFVDVDGNETTGAFMPFFSGADYKIELVGRGGRANNASIFRWNGTSWEYNGSVTVEMGYRALELSADITSGGMMRVFIVATNWLSYRDTIEAPYTSPAPPGLRGTTGEEILHLHYSSTTDSGYMDSITGTTGYITNIPADYGYAWYQTPEMAQDFNITGATVYLYIVPYVVRWWIYRFVPSVNVSLWIYNGSSYRLVGYDFYPAVETEGWYAFTISGSDVVRRGETTVTLVEVTGFWKTSIDVYYNSTDYDSRTVLTGSPTIEVVDGGAWNSSTMEPQSTFSPGESAYLWGNVTDVLGTYDISYVNFTVYYPNGTVWIENASGTLYQEGPQALPYYAIYYISVTFPDVGGVYDVLITAGDTAGNTATFTFQVIVPVEEGISLYPDGLVEGTPGTDVSWDFTLMNIGNVPLTVNITVDGSGGFPFDVYLNGTWVAADVDGDGLWDQVNSSYDSDGNGVPEVYIEPMEYYVMTLVKHVPSGSEGRSDLTVMNASASGVYDTAYLRVNVPYESVFKPLYLSSPSQLKIKYSGTTSSVTIDAGGSVTFSTPAGVYYSVNLTGYVYVHLYIIPDKVISGPWVTVNLYYDSTLIGRDRQLIEVEGWHTFYIDALGVTIPAGSVISLTIEVDGGWSTADIYYDSSTYDSRVEIPTTDYIKSRWVKLYNSTSETYSFAAGETVTVRTSLYTPFGPDDIGGANYTVYDPDGGVAFRGDMVVESAVGGDAIFVASFTLPLDAPVGTWTVLVTYWDDPVVYGETSTTFVVPAGVSVDPDNSAEITPPASDTWLNFTHTVTNTGRGSDYFGITVSGSPGYEVRLYIGGTLAAVDSDGDGVWDYVDPAFDINSDGTPDTAVLNPGESQDITVSVLVPANSTQNFTLRVKAVSHRSASVYDTATDTVTVVPEMEYVGISIAALLIPIIRRKRGKRTGQFKRA